MIFHTTILIEYYSCWPPFQVTPLHQLPEHNLQLGTNETCTIVSSLPTRALGWSSWGCIPTRMHRREPAEGCGSRELTNPAYCLWATYCCKGVTNHLLLWLSKFCMKTFVSSLFLINDETVWSGTSGSSETPSVGADPASCICLLLSCLPTNVL